MIFNYVDIGTSDFETSLEICKPNETILLVEPLFTYLRNLPDPSNAIKANFAISDNSGWGDIFYVPSETIEQHNLPYWVRGCNSLNKPHVNVTALNLPEGIVQTQKVRTITFTQLVDIYEIEHIDQLKTDTEGHDHIILSSVIDAINNGLTVNQIISEYKVDFGNLNEMSEQMNKLSKFGFRLVERFGDNIKLVRK